LTNQMNLAVPLDAELMKDAPKDVLVRVYHGRVLLAEGNPSSAVDQLQRVVADAADSPQAHYFLASAYWQNGQMNQAGTEFQAALKDSDDLPTQAMVLEALARLSLTQEDFATAQSYAAGLVEQFPAKSLNHQLLAEALARQGRLGE